MSPPAHDIPPRPPRSVRPRAQAARATPAGRRARGPTPTELGWLRRGLDQPGGKLPLFDLSGQRVASAVVRTCRAAGWAESWFHNPLKPDWEVCRLTEAGRTMLARISVVQVDFRRAVPAQSDGEPPG